MFPECARVIDLLRPVFGNVKVIWAQEGGNEVGKRT